VMLADGQQLCAPAAAAWDQLQRDARAVGFDLAVASSYRSFDRQLAIFNGKARGERPLHDEQGQPLDVATLAPQQALDAILRFSAFPGGSRHHWGTDLDVYDAAALPADYRLQLSPAEVAPGGLFDPLHGWLDERMARGESHGFFRPYAADRGGVAPERWHLSYAPLARACDRELAPGLLLDSWREVDLALRDVLEADVEALLERYVRIPPDWCPAP